MGMDGLSMSNTGIRREATSLDYSKESEETAKEDTEKSMIVQELTEQERVNEEREENKKRRKPKKEGDSDNEDENLDEDSDEDDEATFENDDEDDDEDETSAKNLLLIDGENNGFYTKLSKNLENIELYDRMTDRLIGTISPEELSALISKLNMGTGIFINKKV